MQSLTDKPLAHDLPGNTGIIFAKRIGKPSLPDKDADTFTSNHAFVLNDY